MCLGEKNEEKGEREKIRQKEDKNPKKFPSLWVQDFSRREGEII